MSTPFGAACRTKVATAVGTPGRPAVRRTRAADARPAGAFHRMGRRAICADAKPGSLRLHDLRDSAANYAVISWRIFRRSASFLGSGGNGPRRATPTLPTVTLSRPRRKSEASSWRRWLVVVLHHVCREVAKLWLVRYGRVGEPDFVHSLWKSIGVRFSKCIQHLGFIHKRDIIVFDQYYGRASRSMILPQFPCLPVQ